jgi:hypothetical protein
LPNVLAQIENKMGLQKKNIILLSLRGWDASSCVIIIGKNLLKKNINKILLRKILPDDGPYRPKHVVMFHM